MGESETENVFSESTTAPAVENVPFDMTTYNDTDGSQEDNTVVLKILLPNQIAENVQGKSKFTWKIGEDHKTLCISFNWPTMSEGAFNEFLAYENLQPTNPRRIAMIKSFEETKRNDNYGKGAINIVLPFLVFSEPRKVLHRTLSDDGKIYIIMTLSKFVEDEIDNEVDLNNPITFRK